MGGTAKGQGEAIFPSPWIFDNFGIKFEQIPLNFLKNHNLTDLLNA